MMKIVHWMLMLNHGLEPWIHCVDTVRSININKCQRASSINGHTCLKDNRTITMSKWSRGTDWLGWFIPFLCQAFFLWMFLMH